MVQHWFIHLLGTILIWICSMSTSCIELISFPCDLNLKLWMKRVSSSPLAMINLLLLKIQWLKLMFQVLTTRLFLSQRLKKQLNSRFLLKKIPNFLKSISIRQRLRLPLQFLPKKKSKMYHRAVTIKGNRLRWQTSLRIYWQEEVQTVERQQLGVRLSRVNVCWLLRSSWWGIQHRYYRKRTNSHNDITIISNEKLVNWSISSKFGMPSFFDNFNNLVNCPFLLFFMLS